MAWGISMAWGAVAGVAQGVGQSVGTQVGVAYQASASKKYYQYLEKLADLQKAENKKRAALNIKLTQDQAMREAQSVNIKAAKVEGAQKAASAGMGIGGGSVTTQNLIQDTKNMADLDRMAIRYGADLNAWKITEDLNYANWTQDVQKEQFRSAEKEVYRAAKVSGIVAIFTGGSGGASAASGIGQMFSGKSQPTSITQPTGDYTASAKFQNQSYGGYTGGKGGMYVPTYSNSGGMYGINYNNAANSGAKGYV